MFDFLHVSRFKIDISVSRECNVSAIKWWFAGIVIEKCCWNFQSEFDSIIKCPNTINPEDLGRSSRILKWSRRRSYFKFFLFIEHETQCLNLSLSFLHSIQFDFIWFSDVDDVDDFFARRMIYEKLLNSEKLTPLLTRFHIIIFLNFCSVLRNTQKKCAVAKTKSPSNT